MTLKLNIDQLIEELRKTDATLTQKEIAERAKVDPGLLSRYVHNRVARVDLEIMGKLFQAFDIEPGPMFRWEDD